MEIDNLNDELCVIKISGIDSPKYLQGQLTNDINELEHKNFQWSAHLNNKGRMLASFIITRKAPECYYLITAKEIIGKIIPRLKMFVLRSKVVIELLDCNIYFSNKLPIEGTILEIIPQYFIEITDKKNENLPCDKSLWKSLLINYGLPIIYEKTQEEFTPQQVNYDLFNGVNFKKGCYTGQEIVARTHYLGKVKRRMFKFVCDFKPEIGQKVVSPNMNNQEIGVIVDYIKREHNYLGLVSIQIDCQESIFLDKENKIQLLIQALEYMV